MFSHDALQNPENLKVLLEQFQDAAFVVEGERLSSLNGALSELLGYELTALAGVDVAQLIAPEDRDWVQERLRRLSTGENLSRKFEFRLQHKNHVQHIEVLANIGVIKATDTTHVLVGTFKDVTVIKRSMEALEAAHQDFEALVENLPDVFLRTDAQHRIHKISPSCVYAVGYQPDEMLGRHLADFFCDGAEWRRIAETITTGNGRAVQAEAALCHKDGSRVWIGKHAFLRHDEEGNPAGFDAVARVMTERKRLEDELRRLSRTDPLTDLYNRRFFMQFADEEIRRSQRYGRPLSLLLFDIDDFKHVNDTHGHPAGDEALRQSTKTCQGMIRRLDVLGRLGGEEFAILMPETPLAEALKFAKRLCSRINETPVQLPEHTIPLSISVGVTEWEDQDQSIDPLYRRADKALYEAKASGKNCVRPTPTALVS